MSRKMSLTGRRIALVVAVGMALHSGGYASHAHHAYYGAALFSQQIGQIPEPCTLTTEDAYTLPVPPPLIVETLESISYPYEDSPDYLHIWYQVIEKNTLTNDDALNIQVMGMPLYSLGGLPGSDAPLPDANTDVLQWNRLTIDLSAVTIDPGDDVSIALEMTTRTNMAQSTLLLVGAVEVSAQGIPDGPTRADSLDYFEYSTDLGAFQDMASMGVVNLRQINMTPLLPSLLLPDAATQNYLGRLGGVNMPYLALNPCAVRAEGDDFIEVIFESDILHEDILTMNRLMVTDILAEEDCCARYHYTVPMHLLNRAGRPRIRARTDDGSRIVVDDFTLSYITRSLYPVYPGLALAMSWIPNGHFESGLYPFVIEPIPPCQSLGNVIIRTNDACRGDYAAVFEPFVASADECAEGALFSQRPTDPLEVPLARPLYTESNGYLYERVPGVAEVRALEWWGLWLAEDEDGAIVDVCAEAPLRDLQVWYWDITATDPVRLDGTVFASELDIDYDVGLDETSAALYRYFFVVGNDIEVMDGWIGLRQASDGACRFSWMVSPDGDSRGMRRHDGDGEEDQVELNVNMSLCVLGGPYFTPSISGCEVTPDIIGRNVDGILTLYGQNLRLLDAVFLAPELALYDGAFLPGDATVPELRYSLNLQNATYSGRLGDRLELRFRFNGPENIADAGNIICTDGRANFAVAINGEILPVGPQDCSILIDTVPPEITIVDNISSDASTGYPRVYDTSRVPPPADYGMPAAWTPSLNMTVTPKNAASFSQRDMHVYLNPGARADVPYADATAPNDTLQMRVAAVFTDSRPEVNGVFFPVQISGFLPGVAEYDLNLDDSWFGPYTYPDIRGAARWNNQAAQEPLLLNATATFSPQTVEMPNDSLSAEWTVESEYTMAEPWRLRFKLEAIDLAGNPTDTADYNALHIHWLYRTRARIQTQLDATVEMPEIFWQLQRPFTDLPEAKPECAPLAKFRLYLVDDTGNLTFIGDSPWRSDALRGTTPMDGVALQTLLSQQQYQGQMLCLAITGADETGNVQHDPHRGAYDMLADLELRGIHYILWRNGERPLPNLAVDTSIRLELFHQRYGVSGRYRNYGPATRVPLPPLGEACDTRVNGQARMRALVPSATQSAGNVGIIWKFYKEGALIARGFANTPLLEGFLMEDLLLSTNPVTEPEHLQDILPDGTLNEGLYALDLVNLLGQPPENESDDPLPPEYPVFNCPDLGAFNFRLGDEGRPPLPADPNAPSERRREIRYTLTAQTVVVNTFTDPVTGDVRAEYMIDRTPATASFSIYVREVEDQVRDEAPVREFGR